MPGKGKIVFPLVLATQILICDLGLALRTPSEMNMRHKEAESACNHGVLSATVSFLWLLRQMSKCLLLVYLPRVRMWVPVMVEVRGFWWQHCPHPGWGRGSSSGTGLWDGPGTIAWTLSLDFFISPSSNL